MEQSLKLSLFRATVIDILDEDNKGKIKVRVLPNLNDVDESLLPWAIPFDSRCSQNCLSMDLPEVGSTIRVLVDECWKRFFYLQNQYFYTFFDFTKISDKLSNLENIDTTYENIIFRLYQDNSLSFHNNLDSSHGYIHSNGSYIYIDSEGSIIASSEKDIKITSKGLYEQNVEGTQTYNTKGDLTLTSDGNIGLKSSKNGKLTVGNSTSTLGKLFVELIDDLAQLQTVGSPGNHTSPTLTAQMNILKQKWNMVFE